jgi:hypothetical protein
MEHVDHEPGTREDCDACLELAYEPGWYKVLRDERVGAPDPTVVRVPDPDEAEVDELIAETPRQHTPQHP